MATEKEKISFLVKNTDLFGTILHGFGFEDEKIGLAHSAFETDWGTNDYARKGNNLFSITKGSSWDGPVIPNERGTLFFRKYRNRVQSLRDYGLLIDKYEASRHFDNVTAFADSISQSPYISETNGDNRTTYRAGIISRYNEIATLMPEAKRRILVRKILITMAVLGLILATAWYLYKNKIYA